MTQIIQIVPRLLPSISGVGDYAFLLAQELRRGHGISTRFIVGDPDWRIDKSEIGNRKSEMELDGFPVHRLKARTAQELLDMLSSPGMPTTVLLHYVGYGYEKRGCPLWLLKALQAWKNAELTSKPSLLAPNPELQCPNSRHLLTMFHELFASGPPWRSSFWTSPLQRWITTRLAECADKCRTNMNRSARTLEHLTPRHRGRVVVRPVFSNLGELENPAPWDAREPWMVVFGSRNWIASSFTRYRDELAHACRSLRIRKVLVIGDAGPETDHFSTPVEATGILAPDAASRWLEQARAGFTSCPVHCLAKSGMFAAYTAHGLLPVVAREGVNDDELVVGSTMLAATGLSEKIPFEQIARISTGAHAWYASHNLWETASSYYDQLVRLTNYPEPTLSR